MKRLAIAMSLLGLVGCARETMLVPLVPTGPARHGGVVLLHGARGQLGRQLPPGVACLRELGRLGVQHRALPSKPGVATPVVIEGPIGGVRFHSGGAKTVVCDCRLALALSQIAPRLREIGVTDVRHSGAYVYRTQKNGKPSLHARSLAIDVHGIAIRGRVLSVETDYRRGLAHACTPAGSAINEMHCRLSQSGLFQELITPDDNRDHHDHLHLAIAPL